MEIEKRTEKQMKKRPAFASQWTLSIAALTIGMAALGCGSTMEDPENLKTIDQGIYGATTSVNDVGENEPEPWEVELSVYHTDPGPDMQSPPAAPLVKSTHSKEGFYEIPLDPGGYVLCTPFRRCTKLSIAAGKTVRADYEFGPGPGWSTGNLQRP